MPQCPIYVNVGAGLRACPIDGQPRGVALTKGLGCAAKPVWATHLEFRAPAIESCPISTRDASANIPTRRAILLCGKASAVASAA